MRAILGVLVLGLLVGCRPSRGASPAPVTPSSSRAAPAGQLLSQDSREVVQEPGAEGELSQAVVATLTFWTLGVREPSPGRVTGWHVHQGSDTCLPTGLGGLSLRKEIVYAKNNESVGLQGDEPPVWITLYVYPAEGGLADEFGAAFGDMGRACDPGPRLSTDVSDSRFPGGGKVGLCGRQVESGLQLVEEIVVFVRGRWVYKMRATWPSPAGVAAHSAAVSAMEAAFNSCPPELAPVGHERM